LVTLLAEICSCRVNASTASEWLRHDADLAPIAAVATMTGIGLIFLILAVVALLAGLYFAAWCLCSVQRGRKVGAGSYIIHFLRKVKRK
jgi:hypothetical protein